MNLLDLLREFGADDALIALAERWTTRTEDGVEALSDDELQSLLDGLMGLAQDDEAGVGLLLAAADEADAVRAEQTGRDEAAAEEDRQAEEARRRLAGEATDEAEASDTGGDDDEADDADADGEADDDAEAAPAEGADDRQPVTAGGVADLSRAARRQRARRHQPADTEAPGQPAARIVFAADVPGISASSEAATLADVDRALVRRSESFRRSSSARGREEIVVATVQGHYPPERRLGPDSDVNAQRITAAITQGTEPAALAAAGGLCAPLTPYYGVPVLGDDRRPVRDALVGFQATRGGITQIAPPILPNLAGSSIIWTAANDEDPDDPATKPCLRVECGEPRNTEMYAVPVCLEFGNFGARTYGELTEAWSTLAMTAQARLAEQTLLAAIKAASTVPNTVETTVSAVIDTLVALDQAATGMRSRHRLPASYPFRVIGPETWLFQARTNMARALPGGSFQENLALAQAAIIGWFSARNFNVTWTPDLGVIGQQAASTALAEPDSTQEWAIYPEGTFLFLDGGTLDLGVVRDSTLNSTNDFQVFSETFEGLHKVGTEALWLIINTCASGAVNGTLDPAALCASYT